MLNKISTHILRFILLILIQVFILNNILFFQLVNPYIYIYFILLLPFNIPKVLIIILGFLMGLCIDLFSGTMAIHAFATTFIAFLRPYILTFFSPHDGYDTTTEPTIAYYDISWWIKYSLLMVFIHHFLLFYLEIFSLNNFFYTLIKVVLSSVLSFIIMLLCQLFFHKTAKTHD